MALRFFRYDMDTVDGLTVRYAVIPPAPSGASAGGLAMITATRDGVESSGFTFLETDEDISAYIAVLHRAMAQFRALLKCPAHRQCDPLPFEGDPWYVLELRTLRFGLDDWDVIKTRELSGEEGDHA